MYRDEGKTVPVIDPPIKVPLGPPAPRALQGVFMVANRRRALRALRRHYGPAFTVDIPIFGKSTVISDPALVKQLFTTSSDVADLYRTNLGRVFGPGSFFSLQGEAHRAQRKILVPPFHGRRLQVYERLVEEETVREMSNWPIDRTFATLPSMMRITLNTILRAVFGAEGAELEALRALLPRAVRLGSRLTLLPGPRVDLGPWSPWGRFYQYRREYDAIIDRLISSAMSDPALHERNDVLAMMLQARYDDGSAMSRSDVADQLVTVLSAGHETTATTLAWTVERLRRHPDVLTRLVEEADRGGSDLRQATIWEVQRTRPVVDVTVRQVKADRMPLGEWVLPRGHTVLVSIGLTHEDDTVFPHAATFRPERFLDAKPDTYTWIPFGGGTRRCLGAAFAALEMNVVLRTLLRDFTLVPTGEPDERWHSRGVAYAPAKGGRAIVRARTKAHTGDDAWGAQALTAADGGS
jgi:cytochrome P450